jgi:uncharacterized protein YfkK (UPF0435 family)
MECEEELCFECAEYHTKLKIARNHHVLDLKLKTSYSAQKMDCVDSVVAQLLRKQTFAVCYMLKAITTNLNSSKNQLDLRKQNDASSVPTHFMYWYVTCGLVTLYFIIIEFTMATATVCDPCHSSNVVNTSVSWCMECEEELCFECAEYHTKLKIARNENS